MATASVHANLYRQQPYDYDLGGRYGAPLASYAPGAAEVCIPMSLYSSAVVEQFQDGDGATLADGTTDFTHVSFPDGKRYVEPIELILKKAGITSSFVTFVEDGMGQILVSDSDAATTIAKLATVGISATVMER